MINTILKIHSRLGLKFNITSEQFLVAYLIIGVVCFLWISTICMAYRYEQERLNHLIQDTQSMLEGQQ